MKTCVVCSSPFVDVINDALQRNVGAAGIERWMREEGHPLKRETIGRHRLRCLILGEAPVQASRPEPEVSQALPQAPPPAPEPAFGVQARGPGPIRATTDFAALVQEKAITGVKSGALRVTTRDGLAAAALLDRREEKREDRKFMLNLAQLLSGGGRQAPADLIEGEFTEVENRLLAPPELRGG